MPTFDDVATDIRSSGMPGASEMSDEEIQEMFPEELYDTEEAETVEEEVEGAEEAPEAEGVAEEASEAEPPTTEEIELEGFEIYVDDEKVEDFSELTASDLLKAEFGYRALNQDQRRELADVVRVAQQGHLNQRRLEQLQQDLKVLESSTDQTTEELSSLRQQSKVWDRALQQAAMGKSDYLEKLVDRYSEELSEEGMEMPSEAQASQQQELVAAGQEVLDQEIRPYLQSLAEKLNVGVKDYGKLESMAIDGIGRIPQALLSPERVTRYLTEDLLYELQESELVQASETEIGNDAVVEKKEDTATQKEIKALKEQIAELKGDKVDEAPPGSGGEGGAGGGEGEGLVPDTDDVDKMMNWLRS